MHSDAVYRLTYLAAAPSLGHHLDHVIRHNAVGRPLAGEVNAFTLSLVIYRSSWLGGLLLYRAGRAGPGFWAVLAITSLYETRVWWQQTKHPSPRNRQATR